MINTTYFLKKLLNKIQHGEIEIKFPNGTTQKFGNNPTLKATLEICNQKAITSTIHEGDIGFGRGYIEGWWKTNDLISLLIILTQNIQSIQNILYGNKLYNFTYRILDLLKRNTIKNSKKNIEYHYDLGNNFYFKWLDTTKTYSSALYNNNETLEEAQKTKYLSIIKHLPQNTSTILEIGCGWGGFIQEITQHNTNIKIKGLTLSNEQFSYVEKKFTNNPNIDVKLQDYRHETNQYDAIISIEMFEAVGTEYWPTYFQQVHNCLNQNGIAVIQTITIDESVFEKYTHTSDFIRHFIFPGGILPTKTIFEKLANEHGFNIISHTNFGTSYYKTLIEWLQKFNKTKEEIKSLNFSEEFFRKWQFYLAYCAASFYSKRTDVFQFVLQKKWLKFS